MSDKSFSEQPKMKQLYPLSSPQWTVDKVRQVYGIGSESSELQFLDVTPNGELELCLPTGRIALRSITENMNRLGVSSFVLRIPELIKSQLSKLYSAFDKATKNCGLNVGYQGVFPVKVNQSASVIDSISLYGGEFGHGWEVGTKPELMIAVSKISQPGKTLVVCNGTKDHSYIETCMLLMEQGHDLIISLESMREVEILISIAAKFPFLPKIGLRTKVLQQIPGHWGHSAGVFSKFGFSAAELQKALLRLKEQGILSAVCMLHGHIGSQMADSDSFVSASKELIQLYAQLHNQGCSGLTYLNLGGGLGIDYDGTRQAFDSGANYTFDQYAQIIVRNIVQALKNRPGIPAPIVITESGRAISAHSSMLFVQLIEKRDFQAEIVSVSTNSFSTPALQRLWATIATEMESLNSLKDLNSFSKKIQMKVEKLLANATIWQHSTAREEMELLYVEFSKLVRRKFRQLIDKDNNSLTISPEVLRKLPSIRDHLSEPQIQLVGNFSVFNGACDSVLVSQVFPVLPISGLDSRPETLVKIVDITCDSDGELFRFRTKRPRTSESINLGDCFTVDGHLMQLEKGTMNLGGFPFPGGACAPKGYVVVALTGAYQDTVHFDQNLLGRVAEASLEFNQLRGTHECHLLNDAERCAELLPKMRHSAEDFLEHVKGHPVLEKLIYSSPYVEIDKPLEISLERVSSKPIPVKFETK